MRHCVRDCQPNDPASFIFMQCLPWVVAAVCIVRSWATTALGSKPIYSIRGVLIQRIISTLGWLGRSIET